MTGLCGRQLRQSKGVKSGLPRKWKRRQPERGTVRIGSAWEIGNTAHGDVTRLLLRIAASHMTGEKGEDSGNPLPCTRTLSGLNKCLPIPRKCCIARYWGCSLQNGFSKVLRRSPPLNRDFAHSAIAKT